MDKTAFFRIQCPLNRKIPEFKAAAAIKAEPIESETVFDCLEEEEKNTLRELLTKLLNAWYSKMDA